MTLKDDMIARGDQAVLLLESAWMEMKRAEGQADANSAVDVYQQAKSEFEHVFIVLSGLVVH